MQPISRLRFDALAGYSRDPRAVLLAEEIGWFAEADERVLGILVRDRIDNDFGGLVLAPDRKGRYRWVHGTEFCPTPRRAQVLLSDALRHIAQQRSEDYHQGDEAGRPLNFFTPMVPDDRLHPSFRRLALDEHYSPAKEIMQAMMRYYEDPDRNFVEQFQTTGFDARLWELYLFAAFVELGHSIARIHAVPDFTCEGLGGKFCVEAVTVNPTLKDGNPIPVEMPRTLEEIDAFLHHYMPIKFGSSLTSKLGKRYWERPNVAGKPLVFAIQDFHMPGSMVWTGTALPVYLYDVRARSRRSDKGELEVWFEPVQTHRWGGKEIPSGFFNLEGAEHVSAVLFSTSGTISKFNRMGWLAGFGCRRLLMRRIGTAFRHDRNADTPLPFDLDVTDPTYRESWAEGLSMFHNPRALHPIPLEWLPGIAHDRFLDGQIISDIPSFHPYGSVTLVHLPAEDAEPDAC